MNRQFELSERDRESLSAIVSLQSNIFSELVQVAGLSKEHDLKGTNLRDIDLSNSDIRGFNLTGADLSGSYGFNIRYDETTILTGAILTDSVLALEKERRDYFAINQEHYSLFKRLKNEYWATGALWATENLRRSAKSFEASSKIAKYLYASVKDQTYKNSLLYGIRTTFATRDEYKAFLLDQLIDPGISYRSIRGVIDILSRSFFSDPTVQNMLLSYLSHESREIRKICVAPVTGEKFLSANRDAVVEQMLVEPDSDIRRLFCKHYAATYGVPTVAVYREDTKSFHDYLEPVDDRTFEQLARGVARGQKSFIKSLTVPKGQRVELGTDVSSKEIAVWMPQIDEDLRRLKAKGLPLELKYNMGKLIDRLVPINAGDGVTMGSENQIP